MGRPAPKFWWDFYGDESKHPSGVLVQSDHPGGADLARFPGQPAEASFDVQIAQAEALISDFRAGRKTPDWTKR